MAEKKERIDQRRKEGPQGGSLFIPLCRQTVDNQAKIAVVLLALIPSLACFYIGGMISTNIHEALPPVAIVVLLFSIGVAAVAGYLILRKYAKSIVKLRRYIAEIAKGTFPESIRLDHASNSDDLHCIEEGLNMILRETEKRMMLIEEKLVIESHLRRALEHQQQVLINAERHRVMLQSLGAACHHLGQPATALRMRLYLMRERAQTINEINDIDESIMDVEAIETVLKKLRDVDEYRTVPYLCEDDSDDNHILAI